MDSTLAKTVKVLMLLIAFIEIYLLFSAITHDHFECLVLYEARLMPILVFPL